VNARAPFAIAQIDFCWVRFCKIRFCKIRFRRLSVLQERNMADLKRLRGLDRPNTI
jgi:hypothetical protein